MFEEDDIPRIIDMESIEPHYGPVVVEYLCIDSVLYWDSRSVSVLYTFSVKLRLNFEVITEVCI